MTRDECLGNNSDVYQETESKAEEVMGLVDVVSFVPQRVSGASHSGPLKSFCAGDWHCLTTTEQRPRMPPKGYPIAIQGPIPYIVHYFRPEPYGVVHYFRPEPYSLYSELL